MNNVYQYKPVQFYTTVLCLTWVFWFSAAIVARNTDFGGLSFLLMALGMLVPSSIALYMVFSSKSVALKNDFKRKMRGFIQIKPLFMFSTIAKSIFLWGSIIAVSIVLSTLFGQSFEQFSFKDFSFSVGGMSTLLLFLVVAFFEELGWRGYAEDSIAFYCCWWKESVLFGVLWSLWHFPLFFIPETYQYNILQISPWFMVNFFISILPLSFITTWVYVKNNRSIYTCMIFHFFINLMQERIAMTDTTKCVQTFVIFLAAGIIVLLNKDLYFGTRHIGNLLPETIEKQTSRMEKLIMNKTEVIKQVSQKSGIATDICTIVIDAFEKQFGDILLKKIKRTKNDISDISTNISQTTNIATTDCEKILTAFKDVFDVGLADKLKFWKQGKMAT